MAGSCPRQLRSARVARHPESRNTGNAANDSSDMRSYVGVQIVFEIVRDALDFHESLTFG